MMRAMTRAALFLLLCLAPPLAAQTVVEGVGAVSESEVDAFVLADADGDGVLVLSEFRVFVRHMAEAGQPTARLIRRFAAYRIAFARVDADRDGRATPSELRSADDTFQNEG